MADDTPDTGTVPSTDEDYANFLSALKNLNSNQERTAALKEFVGNQPKGQEVGPGHLYVGPSGMQVLGNTALGLVGVHNANQTGDSRAMLQQELAKLLRQGSGQNNASQSMNGVNAGGMDPSQLPQDLSPDMLQAIAGAQGAPQSI